MLSRLRRRIYIKRQQRKADVYVDEVERRVSKVGLKVFIFFGVFIVPLIISASRLGTLQKCGCQKFTEPSLSLLLYKTNLVGIDCLLNL
jgi:GTP-sensing pleiotropic transcriptional regulator CodY